MAGMALSLCLVLAAALQGGLTRAPGPPARPGPLLLRLRRLEEQFLRLQEVTLNHLQSIASNYNISYNIDGRFQALAEQAEAADAARAALAAELARLAAAGRRLRRRLKRLEGTVGALSPQPLLTHPSAAPAEAGTAAPGVADAARSRGGQLERQKGARSTPGPRQHEGLWLPAAAGPGGAPGGDEESPRDAAPAPQVAAAALPTVTTARQEQPPAPRQPGEARHGPPVPQSPACRTGAVLLFPNASGEHGAVLALGPQRGLRAVSLCAWLATPAPRLGALLSYAPEGGRSELAVLGCGRDRPGSARFTLGHGQFRELPVAPLLDGKWHHLCLTWCSGQGRYRFYVDRRLLAAGSGFQQGYGIPAGGSLVLGRGQDGPNTDLGAGEDFVGHLAGFALWRQALLPGEVARMASGRGLPRGPLLTLAGASLRGGVRSVACPCLQRCLGRG